jgi:alpha/beta superfamily hydrolase
MGFSEEGFASGWTAIGDSPGSMVHESGMRSSVEFVDLPGGSVFAVVHQPVATPDLAMVLCQPVYAEAARNARRELILAWQLASVGITAARFNYRGAGHSSGRADRITFADMVDDAVEVARWLQEEWGQKRVGFIGTRLGALVAVAAAKAHPGSPLVLWEPPPDMDRYYAEVFRARMIGLVKQGKRMPPGKGLLDQFARDGVLDVLGSPLAHSLYLSTKDLELGELLERAGPRPTSIIQMTVKQEIRPSLKGVLSRRAAAGHAIEASTIPYDEAWWFGAAGHGPVVETKLSAMEAVPRTVDFLLGATHE